MALDWSKQEIALIIADYFLMLTKELAGEKFNKTEHRNSLLPLLNNRSKGSVEFKHQNISAVLTKLGQPFIVGYKPRFNYQLILEEGIVDHLYANSSLDPIFKEFSDKQVLSDIDSLDFNTILVQPPELNLAGEPKAKYSRRVGKTNYLLREQSNSALGTSGESLVLEFEKWSLKNKGKNNLADQVEWVSESMGDGLGFDILSRNTNGTDKFIEVKTTKLSMDTPFYFSKNELEVSIEKSRDYHLYRVFDFVRDPRMFSINGSFDKICSYEAISFRGHF